jgi:thiamine pyrophosphokinase
MKSCLIISGGEKSPIPREDAYDLVIACDHGYDHAVTAGIRPGLFIGDFDSISENAVCDAKIPVLRYPVKKDDSDTMLAVKYALQEGYDHLILTCALGGRLDHLLANLQTLGYAASHGAFAELYGENEYIRTFTGGKLELAKREGYSLSLFSLTDRCEDLCVDGAAYTASGVVLTNTFPLGLSNGWKEETVHISMKKGILLIVESRMP